MAAVFDMQMAGGDCVRRQGEWHKTTWQPELIRCAHGVIDAESVNTCSRAFSSCLHLRFSEHFSSSAHCCSTLCTFCMYSYVQRGNMAIYFIWQLKNIRPLQIVLSRLFLLCQLMMLGQGRPPHTVQRTAARHGEALKTQIMDWLDGFSTRR